MKIFYIEKEKFLRNLLESFAKIKKIDIYTYSKGYGYKTILIDYNPDLVLVDLNTILDNSHEIRQLSIKNIIFIGSKDVRDEIIGDYMANAPLVKKPITLENLEKIINNNY